MISGLKDGEYFLRAGLPNTFIVKSIVAGGVDHSDRSFDASSGADIPDVIVTRPDKVASLAGAVRDRQGAPVTQGVVIVFPADSTLWTRFGLSPRRIKATAFYGSTGYKLTGLPAGEYFVVAVDASMLDAWKDSRFFAAAVGSAARVSLDWGQARRQDVVVSNVVIK